MKEYSPSPSNPYSTHHRRRSSANHPQKIITSNFGTTSGKFGSGIGRVLTTIPGTPVSAGSDMSLSRSPSPQSAGGWQSPGLNTPYDSSSRRSSPIRAYANGSSANNVTWASAKARSAEVRAFTPRNQGFTKHFRKFSNRLPYFHANDYSDKEKLGRGRPSGSKIRNFFTHVSRAAWRLRARLGIALIVLMFISLFNSSPVGRLWNQTFGGGEKFVIILAANQGGGVMEWKGPREWAIERDSVKNKKNYAKRWGYELEIVDMTTKKRYAHEWRESWEKVDVMRATMRKYPHAEWFWWLDLNTFIMEPSYSLQNHIFDDIMGNVYRDINVYNPLNISHPPTNPILDAESLSAEGDGKAASVNFILPQDCGGFNLGSFFMRRSAWTDRLLDIWWDPVHYEQKHMEWEHKEQDALEYMYQNQPWIRPHVAFIPQRKINSFPPGACGEKGENPKIHYSSTDRDFLVNMAGCEWGRDCWGEMYKYRNLSYKMNQGYWEAMVDWVRDTYRNWKNPPKVVVKEKDKDDEKEDKK